MSAQTIVSEQSTVGYNRNAVCGTFGYCKKFICKDSFVKNIEVFHKSFSDEI